MHIPPKLLNLYYLIVPQIIFFTIASKNCAWYHTKKKIKKLNFQNETIVFKKN